MSEHYECHITLQNVVGAKEAIEKMGWKFSKIDGDPVLGVGVKSYATKHFPKSIGAGMAVSYVRDAATKLLDDGLIVLREKVEVVIYDREFLPLGARL
jgi:hypothetical protein